MFSVGDQIVHPMHGAGKIDSIMNRRITGITRSYYVLHIPVGGMTVLIPIDGAEEIGVRALVSETTANDVLASISDINVECNLNWNQRYRENMTKLKSGDLYEVASVVVSLMFRDRDKGLSTGERRMLHTAKQILISELVLTTGLSESTIEQKISEAVKIR